MAAFSLATLFHDHFSTPSHGPPPARRGRAHWVLVVLVCVCMRASNLHTRTLSSTDTHCDMANISHLLFGLGPRARSSSLRLGRRSSARPRVPLKSTQIQSVAPDTVSALQAAKSTRHTPGNRLQLATGNWQLQKQQAPSGEYSEMCLQVCVEFVAKTTSTTTKLSLSKWLM